MPFLLHCQITVQTRAPVARLHYAILIHLTAVQTPKEPKAVMFKQNALLRVTLHRHTCT
jgi:hypothetical protein